MQRSSTIASLIALCALNASAAPPLTVAPAPHTLDRLARPAHPNGSTTARKVSSRLRAAQEAVGPLAGALVPADPPRSPEGKLQVYVDCSLLGSEQLAAGAVSAPCAENVERLVGDVQALALELAS